MNEHANFVTYTWLIGAIGGAVVLMVTIITAFFTTYAAKKVNKETCETIHDGLCKELQGLRDTLSTLVEKSGENHDTLIKIKTIMETNERK